MKNNTDATPLKPINMNKLLIQQQLAVQRQELKFQSQPMINISERITSLFSAQDKSQNNPARVAVITGVALVLAVLGKRRGGWLGKIARYTIINYPGLLHKFIK